MRQEMMGELIEGMAPPAQPLKMSSRRPRRLHLRFCELQGTALPMMGTSGDCTGDSGDFRGLHWSFWELTFGHLLGIKLNRHNVDKTTVAL